MANAIADPSRGASALGSRAARPNGATGATVATSRPGDEPTLGALLASASRDLTGLVHSEIELAKTELKSEVSTAVKGGAMFAAAAVLGAVALLLLCHAAAWGLVALGLPAWAGYLIVAAVFLLVAGVLALIGKRAVSKVSAPERTVRTTKETAAFLKNPLNGHAG